MNVTIAKIASTSDNNAKCNASKNFWFYSNKFSWMSEHTNGAFIKYDGAGCEEKSNYRGTLQCIIFSINVPKNY